MYSSPMPFPNTSSTHATASSYLMLRVGNCGAPARSSCLRMRATSALKSLCLHFSTVYMRPSSKASLYLELRRYASRCWIVTEHLHSWCHSLLMSRRSDAFWSSLSGSLRSSKSSGWRCICSPNGCV